MNVSEDSWTYAAVLHRSQSTRLVFALCVFAMCGAQMFGAVSRFICDCGGMVKVVAASSCSGPHGVGCHSDDAPNRDGSHRGGDDGDQKRHEQSSQELTATSSIGSHVEVPLPVVLAVLPEYFFFMPETSPAPREYLPDAFGGPPQSIVLSRTLVLRI